MSSPVSSSPRTYGRNAELAVAVEAGKRSIIANFMDGQEAGVTTFHQPTEWPAEVAEVVLQGALDAGAIYTREMRHEGSHTVLIRAIDSQRARVAELEAKLARLVTEYDTRGRHIRDVVGAARRERNRAAALEAELDRLRSTDAPS